jgi:hypothetical protein
MAAMKRSAFRSSRSARGGGDRRHSGDGGSRGRPPRPRPRPPRARWPWLQPWLFRATPVSFAPVSDEPAAADAANGSPRDEEPNDQASTRSADPAFEPTPVQSGADSSDDAVEPGELAPWLPEGEWSNEPFLVSHVNTPLPRSSPGHYSRAPATHQFGRPETIAALLSVAACWAGRHPRGPRIAIGQIAERLERGPHAGLDVRLWVQVGGAARGESSGAAAEWRALTRELVALLRTNGIVRVRSIVIAPSRDPREPPAIGVGPLRVRFVSEP